MKALVSFYWPCATMATIGFIDHILLHPFYELFAPIILLGLILEWLEWRSRAKKDRDRMELFSKFFVWLVGAALL